LTRYFLVACSARSEIERSEPRSRRLELNRPGAVSQELGAFLQQPRRVPVLLRSRLARRLAVLIEGEAPLCGSRGCRSELRNVAGRDRDVQRLTGSLRP
jgi:hypothetical protein